MRKARLTFIVIIVGVWRGGVCLMDKAWLYYWQVQNAKIINNNHCARVHYIAGLILCKYILGNGGLG